MKTDEGIKREGYSDKVVEIKAEVWPASGGLQAELYGERLNYIMNANVEKSTEIAEKDGLCIDNPNQVTHRVISYLFLFKSQSARIGTDTKCKELMS